MKFRTSLLVPSVIFFLVIRVFLNLDLLAEADNGNVESSFPKASFMVNEGAIGNRIWNDANANGIQDDEEIGWANAELKLYDIIEDTLVGETITDQSGYYLFENLNSGKYYIEVFSNGFLFNSLSTISNIGSDSLDSDIMLFDSRWITDTIDLGSSEIDTTYDFGFHPEGALGNRVWFDQHNGNQNILDSEDCGLDNVEVRLYQSSTDSLLASMLTDDDGYYFFQGLYPDVYYVEVVGPEKLTFVIENFRLDDTEDSDFVAYSNLGNIGISPHIILEVGEINLNIDAGFYHVNEPYLSCDRVLSYDNISLRAKSDKCSNIIEWNFVETSLFESLIIERSINTLEDFHSIHTQSSSNSNSPSEPYLDYEIAVAGTYYYRILATDKNSKETISNIISVERTKNTCHGDIKVSILPNPVVSKLDIEIYSPNKSDVNVSIYNSTGQFLSSSTLLYSPSSSYKIVQDFSSLVSGIYSVNVEVGGMRVVKSVLKVD